MDDDFFNMSDISNFEGEKLDDSMDLLGNKKEKADVNGEISQGSSLDDIDIQIMKSPHDKVRYIPELKEEFEGTATLRAKITK